VYGILCLYLYQAAVTFAEVRPGARWPLLLMVIRNGIFLFIHEGGHVLFMPFGKTMMLLGGSFWQITFPLISFLIALKQRSHLAPFALFWTGANMLDVSLYMRDAPLRRLLLLGGDKSRHDWHNPFREWNMLGSAATVADLTYFCGLTICIISTGAGIYLAFYRFLHRSSSEKPAHPNPQGKVV
jgi:hypothetical protein